jgi:prolyl-tRNA editing enzyme YbaK/EbsC (Cys-tRNA(Pro) deacylase)
VSDQPNLKGSARRVQEVITAAGHAFHVREFPEGTRTSEQAAQAVGCAVDQIAKSMIFRARETGRSVLVVASGANRVDEKAVGRLLGEKIERADPAFVRDKTGFAIGGVPPLGHREQPVVFLDVDLLNHDTIWAAAGTPNAVFALAPADLPDLTGGRFVTVKKAA